jgi:hypothetical protein
MVRVIIWNNKGRILKKIPVLPWGFFLEGKDSHGDHGLGF